jgi:membrane AbrB-like protein
LSPAPLPSPYRTQAVTIAVAALGGGVMHLLHVPLAWMIGAMVATAALAWSRPVAVPATFRPAGLLFLGLALGSTFSGPVLAAVTAALPVMLLCGLLAILSGLVVARLFTRLAGTDAKTGFFCAVPGGVIVMAMLAQEARASVATVTLAQTMRVLVVVLTFPPLLGWLAPHGDFSDFTAARSPVWWPGLLGMAAVALVVAVPLRRFGIANPWMIGACALGILLAATGNLPSGVPSWLVDAAQVAMGASLGTRLTRSFLLSSRRLAIASVVSAAALSVADRAGGGDRGAGRAALRGDDPRDGAGWHARDGADRQGTGTRRAAGTGLPFDPHGAEQPPGGAHPSAGGAVRAAGIAVQSGFRSSWLTEAILALCICKLITSFR